MSVFGEVFSVLPRQGPGTEADTLSALAHTDLAERPGARILDAGCGTGASTLALARSGHFDITALDRSGGSLQVLQKRVGESADLRGKVAVQCADLRELAYPDGHFDAIWCEGAIYVLGFEEGLRRFAPLVRPGGWVCATEVSWLVDAPPPEALEYWTAEYPEMGSLESNRAAARRAGLECVADFALGTDAWWDDYYGPMQARLAELRPRYEKDAEALAFFESLENEIDVFLRFGPHVYSYVFYVLRRPA